jgi:N-acetylglucosamine-6-phosphate deacetylase
MIALTASALFTPLQKIEQPVVLLEDGKILEIDPRAALAIPSGCRIVDFGDAILAPAYVDIHIHGGAGHDVMETDPGALPALERLLAQHGVGGYLPTTITAPVEQTLGALERLADAIESGEATPGEGGRARPLGIHMEGPFLSHAKRGVHPPESILPPTIGMFNRFWEAARGRIRLMTIAPETEGAQEVIAEAARRGVCVSIGHSDANQEAARAAIDKGARHATHTFNAMRALDHREPGILGVVLSDDRISADIIADGIHVDPAIVKLFIRAKGAAGAVLITDALSATGMPDGRYRLGTLELDVKGGRCTSRGILAGSVLTLDRAVRNVMQFAGCDLQQGVRFASLNPAKAAGLEKNGVLEPAAHADIVVLDRNGGVRKTIIAGAL